MRAHPSPNNDPPKWYHHTLWGILGLGSFISRGWNSPGSMVPPLSWPRAVVGGSQLIFPLCAFGFLPLVLLPAHFFIGLCLTIQLEVDASHSLSPSWALAVLHFTGRACRRHGCSKAFSKALSGENHILTKSE